MRSVVPEGFALLCFYVVVVSQPRDTDMLLNMRVVLVVPPDHNLTELHASSAGTIWSFCSTMFTDATMEHRLGLACRQHPQGSLWLLGVAGALPARATKGQTMPSMVLSTALGVAIPPQSLPA